MISANLMLTIFIIVWAINSVLSHHGLIHTSLTLTSPRELQVYVDRSSKGNHLNNQSAVESWPTLESYLLI